MFLSLKRWTWEAKNLNWLSEIVVSPLRLCTCVSKFRVVIFRMKGRISRKQDFPASSGKGWNKIQLMDVDERPIRGAVLTNELWCTKNMRNEIDRHIHTKSNPHVQLNLKKRPSTKTKMKWAKKKRRKGLKNVEKWKRVSWNSISFPLVAKG